MTLCRSQLHLLLLPRDKARTPRPPWSQQCFLKAVFFKMRPFLMKNECVLITEIVPLLQFELKSSPVIE